MRWIRHVLRSIGTIFTVLGILTLIRDLRRPGDGGFAPESLGAFWGHLGHDLFGQSLTWPNASILDDPRWHGLVAPVFSEPAYLVALVVGLVLILAAWPPRRRRW